MVRLRASRATALTAVKELFRTWEVTSASDVKHHQILRRGGDEVRIFLITHSEGAALAQRAQPPAFATVATLQQEINMCH